MGIVLCRRELRTPCRLISPTIQTILYHGGSQTVVGLLSGEKGVSRIGFSRDQTDIERTENLINCPPENCELREITNPDGVTILNRIAEAFGRIQEEPSSEKTLVGYIIEQIELLASLN